MKIHSIKKTTLCLLLSTTLFLSAHASYDLIKEKEKRTCTSTCISGLNVVINEAYNFFIRSGENLSNPSRFFKVDASTNQVSSSQKSSASVNTNVKQSSIFENITKFFRPFYASNADTLEDKLNKILGKKLNVVSPVGVKQTLALLWMLAPDLRLEIESFAGSTIVNEIGLMNTHFKSIHDVVAKPYSGFYCFGEEGEKKFTFRNNLYALITSTNIKFNEDALNNFRNQAKEKLGVKLLDLDFSDPQKAAKVVNDLAKQDTFGKIPEIVKADDLKTTSDSAPAFFFMHTIYIKAKWKYDARVSEVDFKKSFLSAKKVKAFQFDNKNLKVYDSRGATFVSIPTIEDAYVLIRHHPREIRAITSGDLTVFKSNAKITSVDLVVPKVSMEAEHDLKELLKNELPDSLTKEFSSLVSKDPFEITKYIQKVTFDMDEEGLEAAAVTAMEEFIYQNCLLSSSKPRRIRVDSPFSFVLVKTVGDTDYPLFYGQVTDFDSLTATTVGLQLHFCYNALKYNT